MLYVLQLLNTAVAVVLVIMTFGAGVLHERHPGKNEKSHAVLIVITVVMVVILGAL